MNLEGIMLSENISQTKRKTLCGVINRWNIKSDLEKQGREVAAGAGGGGYRESLVQLRDGWDLRISRMVWGLQ